MKKTLLLLIALMPLAVVNAQQYHPFPVSNAIWHQSFGTGENSLDTSYYFSYGLIGDTIINAIEYSKVYKLHDTTLNSNAEYYGCLREDPSKRVFYLGWDFWKMQNHSQEIQLYDFSKTVGDTIDYGIWGRQPITAVDSILIGSQYRRQFVVQYDTIVEGIGCLRDLLFPITAIPTKVATKWDLVCFKQNEEVLYLDPDYPSCFPSADGIKENPENDKGEIKIFPQPLISRSEIDLTGIKTQFNYLTIYNVFGQMVYRKEISNISRVPLSRIDFSPGLLLYKLEADHGQCISGKIMVE
jgi:hypothetical protein